MTKRVAIEEGLANVKNYLRRRGYDVVELHEGQAIDCDCCVISGGDENVAGMQDVTIPVPVIDARGMTPATIQMILL